MADKEVMIKSPTIRLDQFLKWAAITATGGQAKELISAGMVKVNGSVELRRSHTLRAGDEVEVSGVRYRVTAARTD